MQRPKIVCLCGSTKFKDEFIEQNKQETLKGNIVLTVGFFLHQEEKGTITEDQKIKLDQLHFRKIDLADEIIVIDVGGYIGSSTKNEIEYATSLGKPISYYSEFN